MWARVKLKTVCSGNPQVRSKSKGNLAVNLGVNLWRTRKHHTPTWKMYSLHNAWCCQSRTPPQVSRPRLVPSSGSYIPVLFIYIYNGLNAGRNFCKVTVHTSIHTLRQHTCSNSTWLNVVSDDAYMLVAVWTSVFMPEADHVAEFMHHDAKLITVLSYRDGLRAATSPPHVGATPAGGDTVEVHILQHLHLHILTLCWTARYHFPTVLCNICHLFPMFDTWNFLVLF